MNLIDLLIRAQAVVTYPPDRELLVSALGHAEAGEFGEVANLLALVDSLPTDLADALEYALECE